MRIRYLTFALLTLASAANIPAGETRTPERSVSSEKIAEFWDGLKPQEQEASDRFKSEIDRKASWKTLQPTLREGLSSAYVERLLGKPEQVTDGGTVWLYSLYYSAFARIQFDPEMKIVRISDR